MTISSDLLKELTLLQTLPEEVRGQLASRMTERSFVLVPLAEVAPGWRHPVTGQGVGELLAGLPDRDVPKKLA